MSRRRRRRASSRALGLTTAAVVDAKAGKAAGLGAPRPFDERPSVAPWRVTGKSDADLHPSATTRTRRIRWRLPAAAEAPRPAAPPPRVAPRGSQATGHR